MLNVQQKVETIDLTGSDNEYSDPELDLALAEIDIEVCLSVQYQRNFSA